MASADGAKKAKDNLGTQSVNKAPFCICALALSMNAPLSKDNFQEGYSTGYRHTLTRA